MNRLADQVIIVTGGSGLLGKSILELIKKEGGFYVNADLNQETSKDLSQVHCDITDETSVKNCISLVLGRFGKINGLVNNAYPRTADWGKKFEDIEYESWQKNIDWQLNSYFYFIQQVAAVMTKVNAGSIVNMASIYGMVGPDFTVYDGTTMTMPAAYAAIKGGLINLTRYLAAYLGPSNIRVNSVSPGGIFDHQNPVFVENYTKKVPMRRMGLPEDISPLIVFLLSDEARYISGQNIAVDGGWTSI